MKIVVTNDDGPHTPVLEPVVKALEERGHAVVVVVPERQRSATGLARTYHKPLRARKIGRYYLVNGFPTDAVFLALNLIAPDAELVVSGINIGENIGFESTYGSGTVAAAIQAGVLGRVGLAVSMEPGADLGKALSLLSAFVEALDGYRRDGLLAVSVNLPEGWSGRLASPRSLAVGLYAERLYKFVDPRGEEFYWRWGPRREEFPRDTDAYAFYAERAATAVGICAEGVCQVEDLVRRTSEIINGSRRRP
ncbi:MAG: 5'/3'-nucleotidase SurE [Thermoproteus sp.]